MVYAVHSSTPLTDTWLQEGGEWQRLSFNESQIGNLIQAESEDNRNCLASATLILQVQDASLVGFEQVWAQLFSMAGIDEPHGKKLREMLR